MDFQVSVKRYGCRNERHLFVAVLTLLMAASLSFSSNFMISIKGPYDNGSIVIPNRGAGVLRFVYDSITFSNGVLLSFYNQKTLILESMLFKGIAVDSTPDVVKAGFKYEKSASWKASAAKSSIVYYASSDTIWAESKKYPDSLVSLDSLHTYDYPSQLPKKGKWLYYSYGDLTFKWENGVENFNNLFYIQARQNKMKLQISSIFTSFISGTKLDSLKLLWAVDSAGNGQFKDNTGIKDIPGSPQDRILIKPQGKVRLRDPMNSGNQIEFYSISGRRVRYPGGVSRAGLPGGVLLYKVDGSANPSSAGKIIIR